MNKHNDLLKACTRRPSTLGTIVRIVGGWAVVLVIMAMIAVATVSPS